MQAKADIAKQVRHNLRTPLAALMRIPGRLPDSVRSDKELLSSSISQIRAIISALDDNHDQRASEFTSNEIYDSLTKSAGEVYLAVPKNIKFEYDIDDSIISARVPHIPHELRAIIGNIVNNSLDAIGASGGRISLAAKDIGIGVNITISDSGRGISKEIIDRIFEDGFSSRKPSGSGIGLYHARTWIEKWNGQISAESEINKLTAISIFLPIENRTAWYVPRLKFLKDDTIFILDDQISAHHLWQQRLEELGILDQAHFASTPEEIKVILKKENIIHEKSYFLFDYDLSAKQTGLDILNSLADNGRKYLVTGHFDEPTILQQCSEKGVYLLPKGTVATIPIVVL